VPSEVDIVRTQEENNELGKMRLISDKINRRRKWENMKVVFILIHPPITGPSISFTCCFNIQDLCKN
jgi:acetyl-CoA carboxylase beta subunit